jgi:hypothetical protein
MTVETYERVLRAGQAFDLRAEEAQTAATTAASISSIHQSAGHSQEQHQAALVLQRAVRRRMALEVMALRREQRRNQRGKGSGSKDASSSSASASCSSSSSSSLPQPSSGLPKVVFFEDGELEGSTAAWVDRHSEHLESILRWVCCHKLGCFTSCTHC